MGLWAKLLGRTAAKEGVETAEKAAIKTAAKEGAETIAGKAAAEATEAVAKEGASKGFLAGAKSFLIDGKPLQLGPLSYSRLELLTDVALTAVTGGGFTAARVLGWGALKAGAKVMGKEGVGELLGFTSKKLVSAESGQIIGKATASTIASAKGAIDSGRVIVTSTPTVKNGLITTGVLAAVAAPVAMVADHKILGSAGAKSVRDSANEGAKAVIGSVEAVQEAADATGDALNGKKPAAKAPATQAVPAGQQPGATAGAAAPPAGGTPSTDAPKAEGDDSTGLSSLFKMAGNGTDGVKGMFEGLMKQGKQHPIIAAAAVLGFMSGKDVSGKMMNMMCFALLAGLVSEIFGMNGSSPSQSRTAVRGSHVVQQAREDRRARLYGHDAATGGPSVPFNPDIHMRGAPGVRGAPFNPTTDGRALNDRFVRAGSANEPLSQAAAEANIAAQAGNSANFKGDLVDAFGRKIDPVKGYNPPAPSMSGNTQGDQIRALEKKYPGVLEELPRQADGQKPIVALNPTMYHMI